MTTGTKDSYQYDLLLRIPTHWEDRTVVLFLRPPTKPGQYQAKLVVTRHPRTAHETVGDIAEKAIEQLSHRMPGFALGSSGPSRVGDRAAHFAQFTWDSPEGRLTQTQTYVSGAYSTVLCITTAALLAEYSALEPEFREILSTMRLPTEL